MPLVVRWYLWLDGKWAVPWIALSTIPSASRLPKGAVGGGVRLVEDERQVRRINERRPAEGVE